MKKRPSSLPEARERRQPRPLCACPDLRILVVSFCDERLYAEWTLRAGAHGFIASSVFPDSPQTCRSGSREITSANPVRISGRSSTSRMRAVRSIV